MDAIQERKRFERIKRTESNATYLQRVANNYPSMNNNFYKVFMSAEISDYRNISDVVRKMGDALCAMGLITLWDDVNLNVSYYSKDIDDTTLGVDQCAYTDFRTNRTFNSGSFIRLSVTTPLNNKTSEVVEIPFRYKTDFRYLAYVTAKVFLMVLDNLCYNENRIAFLNAKMEKQLTEICDKIK